VSYADGDRFLDAPSLRAWIEAERGGELGRLQLLDPAAERALRRWRTSRTARVEAADTVLVLLDLELAFVPDALWRRKRSGQR
jgi:hypothetical protein